MIALTGATGLVGGLVRDRLDAAGTPTRLIVRSPARLVRQHPDVWTAGYGDAEALAPALTGVDTLFMVSASESAERVAEHRTLIDSAAAAGVERIVYLSFLGADPQAEFTLARDHAATETHLRASGLAFTFLRDNFYHRLIAQMCGADGVIRGPGGEGRIGSVAHTDVADAVAAVLGSGSRHDGETFTLTGPRGWSLREGAAELARVTGRPIRYERETEAEAWASRAHYGAPDWEVAGWISSYLAIATGVMDVVTDDVERLTGHPPQDLPEFLRATPDAWAHLRL